MYVEKMKIVYIDPEHRYGFHVRTRPSLTETVKATSLMYINAMQLYLV